MKNIHKKEHRFLSIVPDREKSHIIIHAVVSFIYAVALTLIGVHVLVSIFGGLLLFAALHFKFVFGETLKAQYKFLFLLIFSAVIFIIMQTIITAGLLIQPIKFIFNILIIFAAVSLVWIFGGSIKVSVTIVSVFITVLSVVDYVMVQARSFEFQFSDFASMGTGLSVASKYSFALSVVSYLGIVLMVAFVTMIIRAKFPKHDKVLLRTGLSLASVAIGFLTFIIIYNGLFAGVIGYTDKYWKFRGSENNGFLVNMVYSAYATKVVKPNGYDPANLEKETNSFIAGNDWVEKDDKKKPNVIIIMNETFADVQNITAEYAEKKGIDFKGNLMETISPETGLPMEVTPFLDSLENSDTLKRGRALASVYGGNTANSEMEVLTGHSMQFMPRNTVCYNLYFNQTNAFSIVDLYNKAGYKTIGMHPEDPTNWRRNVIYPTFGFSETYFRDDFDTSQEGDIFRDHVSDSATYRKIEELFESKGDNPLFLFAVTMQNHGGYGTLGFDSTVDINGFSNYNGVREYLTCINNSDTALKNLIEYFEKVKEDTIILFFGDHQPSLSKITSKFYGIKDSSPQEDQQTKYLVPFFFWSNYDTSDVEVGEFTSLNFLSPYLLQMTGIEPTEYFKFISEANYEIEALNANGYYDRYHVFHTSTYSAPKLTYGLGIYSRLQYNAMFDTVDKKTQLFK